VLTPSRYAVYAARKNAEDKRKERAIIARFDHRPVLKFLAFATFVCVLMVALTLFVSAQAVPSSGPSVDLNAAPSHSEIVQTMLL
jgi:hypothetical protein